MCITTTRWQIVTSYRSIYTSLQGNKLLPRTYITICRLFGSRRTNCKQLCRNIDTNNFIDGDIYLLFDHYFDASIINVADIYLAEVDIYDD